MDRGEQGSRTSRSAPSGGAEDGSVDGATIEDRLEQTITDAETRWQQRQKERTDHLRQLEGGNRLGADTEQRTRKRLLRVMKTDVAAAADPEAVASLLSSLEAPAAVLDLGLERVLGRNDLLSVAWLAQGLQAARAVGRIVIGGAAGRPQGFGTGAMVSRRLLLTNHHVLHDVDEAQRSGVEFGFQLDPVGQLQSGTFVRLDPAAFFVTDPALDFTLVAVGTPADGRPVFDPIPLLEEEGKVIIGESVSIIQHPQGEPKQLALRENELLDILENFVHYRTDTAPGSSGSPVFNDQWEMVALHHSGVPRRDEQGRILTRDGQLWTRDMGEHRVDWLANEGARVSRIVKHMRSLRLAGGPAQLRDELFDSQGSRRPAGPDEMAPTPRGHFVSALAGADAGERRPAVLHGASGVGGSVTVTVPLEVTLRLAPGAPAVPPAVSPASAAAPLGAALLPSPGGEAGPLRIPAGELRAGDVLLYRGRGWISTAIRFFDGTDVSHAGLYVGNGQVVEAIGEGVVRRDLATSAAGADWLQVRRLKRAPADMNPVKARGEHYVSQGNRYAYEQIVLLGILILVRKVSPNPALAWLVRNAVSLATSFLSRLLNAGKEPMICSELVFRAYDEALPAADDRYTIHIANLSFEAHGPLVGRERTPGGERGKGEGVHPGSLIAWAAAASPLQGVTEAPSAGWLETAQSIDEAARQQELELAITQYIQAARTGRTTVPVPQVSEEELRAEITRFATYLYATQLQRDRVTGGESARDTSAEEALRAAAGVGLDEALPLPQAFAHFFRTAADFVTPGDLYKTQSLASLGELSPAP